MRNEGAPKAFAEAYAKLLVESEGTTLVAVECWGTGLTEAWKESGLKYAAPVTLEQNLTVVLKVLTDAVRASTITFAHFWMSGRRMR